MKRNLSSLKRLISHFEPKKYMRLSKEQKFELINEIFFFDRKIEKRLMLREVTQTHEYVDVKTIEHPFATREYQLGATFTRVRKLNDLLVTPVVADFWEAPADFIPQGRANQAKEPLLYVATDLNTALLETRTTKVCTYNLNLYKALSPIFVTEIGFSVDKNLATKNSIRRTIQEFTKKIFLKKGSSAYDVSNFLAKRFYSIANDGWVYPSVANDFQGENLCISKEGKSKLELIASFAFRNQIPVASYSVNPLGEINISYGIDSENEWEKISKDPKVFGKQIPIQLEKTFYFEKIIHEL